MTTRVAINGYGRIGRNILRAFYESKDKYDFQIVAINNLGNIETDAHLTRYDSTHGRFHGDVSTDANKLIVNGDPIVVTSERNPENLEWEKLGVDLVLECTGHFTSKEKSTCHLKAGAKKVIISAPATGVDATIVYGVNQNTLRPSDTIISNASCTTNCLAPLAKVINDAIGIENGLMVTIHAMTNDQSLLDGHHSDLHRARTSMSSLIPTKTGAAAALGLVLPELDGKLDGYAVRVPTINVSLVDLTFEVKRKTTVAEINDVVKKATLASMKGILVYNDEPLVSIDFNHNSASSIFDATQTRMVGDLVKVLAWYDNEWGFSNRMLDLAQVFMRT
ncbi:MAG: type I glyceraldehyde-3-phosphate dehydrogenase [Gammaproteobacteria bacterium]